MTFKPWTLTDFMTESLRIEGIYRAPTKAEMEATSAFLALPRPEVADVESLVSVYAPGHRLRDQPGLNVRVGDYVAPYGGPAIRMRLQSILDGLSGSKPWETHVSYETLHPFTDGNGRSGRALWLWMHGGQAPIGFLHRFYYETLAASPGRRS